MSTPQAAPITVGVSLKAYFTHARATSWFGDVAARVAALPAIADGRVRLFVIPSYLQIPAALATFAGTPVLVGAQDVSAHPPGAFTGEVTAAELAEVGVRVAEIGHAERRRLFGETDSDTAAKAAAALSEGITPVLCIGEESRMDAAAAARANLRQLRADLDGTPAGPVVVAYEPVWAIGAAEPAPDGHISVVTRALRAALEADPARDGSAVIYGGSAGPGLLTRLGDAVDGLFLGRFAHDPDALIAVLDEASALAASALAARTPTATATPTPTATATPTPTATATATATARLHPRGETSGKAHGLADPLQSRGVERGVEGDAGGGAA